jgi:hypothetical protein
VGVGRLAIGSIHVEIAIFKLLNAFSLRYPDLKFCNGSGCSEWLCVLNDCGLRYKLPDRDCNLDSLWFLLVQLHGLLISVPAARLGCLRILRYLSFINLDISPTTSELSRITKLANLGSIRNSLRVCTIPQNSHHVRPPSPRAKLCRCRGEACPRGWFWHHSSCPSVRGPFQHYFNISLEPLSNLSELSEMSFTSC